VANGLPNPSNPELPTKVKFGSGRKIDRVLPITFGARIDGTRARVREVKA